MTWFIASVIILFIMFAFVAITASLALQRLKEKGKVEIREDNLIENLEIQRSLMTFLNSPVGEGTIMELIIKLEKEGNDENSASDIFKENANRLFSTYFPKKSWEKGVHPWWVKVQNINDKIKRPTLNCDFCAGAFNCDSQGDITSVINIGDKKVVFCIFKTYIENVIK